METKTQTNATAAAYMREHRAAWRSAGFTGVNNMAHEKDAMLIQAYTNIVKFERMLSMVVEGDDGAIRLAITRNAPKMPAFDAMNDLTERVTVMVNAGKPSALKAHDLLSAISNYAKKAAAGRTLQEDEFSNDALRARNTIYSNLAVATYKLAEALLDAPTLEVD